MSALLETSFDLQVARANGYRSGRLDAFIGRRSDYAWFSTNDRNEYTREFGEGYRRGFREQAEKLGRIV